MWSSARRLSRVSTGTGLVIVALVFVTLVALVFTVPKFGGRNFTSASPSGLLVNFSNDGRGTWNTRWGPLTPLDRDFVRKVRMAGLWEQPAGVEAQQRGTTQAVKIAGMHLIMGHTQLNNEDFQVGQKLHIDLPDQPSAQQQGWLAQLQAAHGTTWDWLFANLLRRAHGIVFGLVAQARAQTQNSLVRALATQANTTVLDHISILEKTGFVDMNAWNHLN